MAKGRKEPCWSTSCAIASYTLIYQQIYKDETKELKNYESCIISISNQRKTLTFFLCSHPYFLGHFSGASKTPFSSGLSQITKCSAVGILYNAQEVGIGQK